MIAVFLPGYEFRGEAAPYLWIFYRMLSSIKEPCLYLVGESYLIPGKDLGISGRIEVSEEMQARLSYRLPSPDVLDMHDFEILPEDYFNDVVSENGGNLTAAFRAFLTEEIPSLTHDLRMRLGKYSNIEAILTWCNCPSLAIAAGSVNIPVMHLELGPLRRPGYHATAYLDFKGVNGYTEARSRYLSDGAMLQCNVSMAELFKTFRVGGDTNVSGPVGDYEIGIPLQVEDDSNLVAYGNDFDNCALLSYSKRLGKKNILVRAHPGSQFSLKPGAYFSLDDSTDSLSFVQRCKKIITINSSVGLEALLLSVPTEVLGDASYLFISEAKTEQERTNRMYYYLFAYLVPFRLIFNSDYLRFRLGNPQSSEIADRHMNYYLLEKSELIRDQQRENNKLSAEVVKLKGELEQQRRSIDLLKGSRSWRITSPLRRIDAVLKDLGRVRRGCCHNLKDIFPRRH